MAARQAHPLRLTQEGENQGTEVGPEDHTKEDVAMALMLERDGRTRLHPIDEASYVHGTSELAAHLPREIWHTGSTSTVPSDVVEESDSVPEWWDTFACEAEEVLGCCWPVLDFGWPLQGLARIEFGYTNTDGRFCKPVTCPNMHSAVEPDLKRSVSIAPCSLVPSALSSEF